MIGVFVEDCPILMFKRNLHCLLTHPKKKGRKKLQTPDRDKLMILKLRDCASD